MINYDNLAKEWIHNVIVNDQENFSQSYSQIQQSMENEYGSDFNMNTFILNLGNVEKQIYEILKRNGEM